MTPTAPATAVCLPAFLPACLCASCIHVTSNRRSLICFCFLTHPREYGADQLGKSLSEGKLRDLKLGALSKLAVASGVDPGALEQAQDADEPREAVVELLLRAQHPAARRRSEQLNSKTPYGARLAYRLADVERIQGRASDPSADASVGTGAPYCEPVAAYGVLRHGTRYPTAKDWKKMARLGERVRVHDPDILPSSLRWLSDWTPPVPEHEDGTLHDTGRREHHALARRLQERLPTLFPADLDQHRAYEFSATAKPRTQQSARAFAAGLAGLPYEAIEAALPQLEHAPIDADRLLRFHTMCPRYTAEVKKNDTLSGDDGGLKGATAATLLPAVAWSVRNSLTRAGVSLAADAQTCGRSGVEDRGERCTEEWDVDVKAMKAIWKACQWETLLAIDKQQSAWCEFLTAEDVQMMELLGDIDMYWEKGPGLRLPSLMACELLQDAAAKLTEWAELFSGGAASSETSDESIAARTTLRFAHAETVVPLLGILGITFGQHAPLVAPSVVEAGEQSGAHKVDNVTAARFALDALDGRSWRSSVISPMAANVVLLLQHCQAAAQTNDGQTSGNREVRQSLGYIKPIDSPAWYQ